MQHLETKMEPSGNKNRPPLKKKSFGNVSKTFLETKNYPYGPQGTKLWPSSGVPSRNAMDNLGNVHA